MSPLKEEKPPPPPSPATEGTTMVAINELVKGREVLAKLMGKLEREEEFPLAEEAMRLMNGALLVLLEDEMGKNEISSEVVKTLDYSTMVKKNKKIVTEKKEGIRKRRTTSTCPSSKITSTTLEDEFRWRKYGQKMIQNFKNPRNYYKCAYSESHGCSATRHAQTSEDDPSLYHITYISHHTCKKVITPQKYHMINFGSSTKSNIAPSSSSSSSYKKQQIVSKPDIVENLTPPETVADVISMGSMGWEFPFLDDNFWVNDDGYLFK